MDSHLNESAANLPDDSYQRVLGLTHVGIPLKLEF